MPEVYGEDDMLEFDDFDPDDFENGLLGSKPAAPSMYAPGQSSADSPTKAQVDGTAGHISGIGAIDLDSSTTEESDAEPPKTQPNYPADPSTTQAKDADYDWDDWDQDIPDPVRHGPSSRAGTGAGSSSVGGTAFQGQSSAVRSSSKALSAVSSTGQHKEGEFDALFDTSSEDEDGPKASRKGKKKGKIANADGSFEDDESDEDEYQASVRPSGSPKSKAKPAEPAPKEKPDYKKLYAPEHQYPVVDEDEMRKLPESEDAQLKKCTFKPNINKKGGSSMAPEVLDRLAKEDVERRKQVVKNLTEQHERAEMEECTFQPKITADKTSRIKVKKPSSKQTVDRLWEDIQEREKRLQEVRSRHVEEFDPPKKLKKKQKEELDQRIKESVEDREKRLKDWEVMQMTKERDDGAPPIKKISQKRLDQAADRLYEDEKKHRNFDSLRKLEKDKFKEAHPFKPHTNPSNVPSTVRASWDGSRSPTQSPKRTRKEKKEIEALRQQCDGYNQHLKKMHKEFERMQRMLSNINRERKQEREAWQHEFHEMQMTREYIERLATRQQSMPLPIAYHDDVEKPKGPRAQSRGRAADTAPGPGKVRSRSKQKIVDDFSGPQNMAERSFERERQKELKDKRRSRSMQAAKFVATWEGPVEPDVVRAIEGPPAASKRSKSPRDATTRRATQTRSKSTHGSSSRSKGIEERTRSSRYDSPPRKWAGEWDTQEVHITKHPRVDTIPYYREGTERRRSNDFEETEPARTTKSSRSAYAQFPKPARPQSTSINSQGTDRTEESAKWTRPARDAEIADRIEQEIQRRMERRRMNQDQRSRF